MTGPQTRLLALGNEYHGGGMSFSSRQVGEDITMTSLMKKSLLLKRLCARFPHDRIICSFPCSVVWK